MVSAFGSSIWNHIPAACGAWLLHDASESAPAAPAGLWLAVSFHVGSGSSTFGSEASSSATDHGVLRDVVAERTRFTSAALTSPLVLPKLVRTYEATAATQSSGLLSIGTITSV